MGLVNIAEVSQIERIVSTKRKVGSRVLGIFQEQQAASMAAAEAARE